MKRNAFNVLRTNTEETFSFFYARIKTQDHELI